MSSVQVVLKVDEKVFTLKFAYALDEELCASFPVNSKSWNDAIALIQGPYMAQVEGTETTFIPDLSMVPRIKIKKIFIFTKYEFILTQFGVDIYNFHEGTLTLRIKTISKKYYASFNLNL